MHDLLKQYRRNDIKASKTITKQRLVLPILTTEGKSLAQPLGAPSLQGWNLHTLRSGVLEFPAIKKRGWAFVVQGGSWSDVSGPAASPQQLEISYQYYDLVPLTATSCATSSPARVSIRKRCSSHSLNVTLWD